MTQEMMQTPGEAPNDDVTMTFEYMQTNTSQNVKCKGPP